MSAILPVTPCLPYTEVRPHLRSGDRLLCSGTSAFARMIQAATDSVWSHVALILWAESLDRVLVAESVESIGTRVIPLRKYVENYSGTRKPYPGTLYVARHRQVALLPSGAMHRLAQGALDLMDAPYDNRQIASIALRITAAKLGLPAQPPVVDQAFICSEFAWLCLHQIGIPVAYDVRGFIAPDDFVQDAAVEVLWEVAL